MFLLFYSHLCCHGHKFWVIAVLEDPISVPCPEVRR
uniref:Uncharacterized protein n=1 Tax=Lepeophtheirus salmonis TaxID=72036 RepID=A0A0K2TU84_LEPSM